MTLRLINSDSCPGDESSRSLRPSGTSFSVEEDCKSVFIRKYVGNDGDYPTFEEAKETAIYLLELLKCDLDEKIDEIRDAETYEDLYFGRMSGGTPDDEDRGTR